MSSSVSEIVELMQLERVASDVYRGFSPAGGTPSVFGGQILGQSIMAMGRSVPEHHVLHSVHCHFIHAGDIGEEILFKIDPIRDGRSFSTRLVVAMQGDKRIFSGSASFQAPEGTHARFAEMPRVPSPEALEDEADYLARIAPIGAYSKRAPPEFFNSVIERRSADWRHPIEPGQFAPHVGIWCRLREPIGDDRLLHQAMIAFISDVDLMFASMRPRGFGALDPAVFPTSLDHAMWFHRPMRADQWFYYDIDSPAASSNRGLGHGSMYQNDQLAVTALQEGLLRELRR
jgi:acyl-CoA thioesterase-2